MTARKDEHSRAGRLRSIPPAASVAGPSGFFFRRITVLAWDAETHPFGPANMAPPIVCVTWAASGDEEVPFGATLGGGWGYRRGIVVGDELDRFLDWVFTEYDGTQVGHNLAYDLACVMSRRPDLVGRIFDRLRDGKVTDSMVRERLLEIHRGYAFSGKKGAKGNMSLEVTAFRRFGLELEKEEWRTGYAKLDGVPLTEWPRGAIEYALDDAEATLLIALEQTLDATRKGYGHFEGEAVRQTGFALPMHLMGVWGVRTDGPRVEALVKQVEAAMLEARTLGLSEGLMSLKKDGSAKRNLKLIQARVEEAFERLERPVPKTPPSKTHPTGQVKTDKETMEATGDQALMAVSEFIGLQKVMSTYLIHLLEGVRRPIHARFNVLGADSGRTSCSGPNHQNPPREGGVRECYIPREGWVYIGADYDTQELRTLAQVLLDVLGRSGLAERYQADPEYDPHSKFAGEMLHIDYEEAMRRKAAKDPQLKDTRQRAKAANFGFPGGLGAWAFMSYARGYGIDLSPEEAEELREHWFESLPEMHDYFDWCKACAGSREMRSLRSGRIRGRVGFTQVANGMFQGLAADASKTAAFLVARACYADEDSPLYGCRPVLFVHDEIVAEAPEERAHEAAVEMSRLMVEAQEMWTPDVPARATPAVMRRWSKDAEPLYGPDGRLIPWDDTKENES